MERRNNKLESDIVLMDQISEEQTAQLASI